MSSLTENPAYGEELTPEEHVAEVNELLGEVERRVNKTENSPFTMDYEKTSPYKEENDWEDETAMTRGSTSIHEEDQFSKPELHAKGAQKIKDEYGIKASSIAEIQLDGIGERSAITSEYSIELNFEEGKGLQYELERKNVNARDIDEQPSAAQDLEYLENQIEGVIHEFNGTAQEVQPEWNYGHERAEALDD